MTSTIRHMICRKCQWGYPQWQHGPDASIDNVCPICRDHPERIAEQRNLKFEQVRQRLGLTPEQFATEYADVIARIVAQEAT